VNEALIAVLCAEVAVGRLHWSGHYTRRLWERAMPDRAQIHYLLCEDDAEVRESDTDGRGRNCLIWGIMADGRVGHVLCSHPPNPVVVTAYWPDTEPEEWTDNYKQRIRRQ